MEDRFTFRRYLRLLGLYARMDLGWLTQDTKYSLICIFSDMLGIVSSISSVTLLAIRFGGIGGLSEAEMLFMLGFMTLAWGAFTMLACNFNVGNISRRIGRSQLDHMMIQPLPLAAQLATEGFAPFTGISGLICGAGVIAWAASRLETPLMWWAWPVMALLIVCAVGIRLGMSYLISATAFYRPVSCEEISSVMLEALGTLAQFPLGGLGAALQGLLTTMLPAGLLGWFPALLMLGKADLMPGLLLPVFICTSACLLATLAFRKGLKHYVKVGSNRYRSMGHRN